VSFTSCNNQNPSRKKEGFGYVILTLIYIKGIVGRGSKSFADIWYKHTKNAVFRVWLKNSISLLAGDKPHIIGLY
jgi:hypothetical protein